MIDDLLALKLKLDYSTLDGVQLNRGGGYDVDHSKFEIGNFLVNVAYERFTIDWLQPKNLPFPSENKHPLPAITRYHLQTHIPYRLDHQRLWLGYLGAQWAYEKGADDSLSLQGYLLYSKHRDELNSWQLGIYLNHHPVETVILPIFEYTYNFPFKRRTGYYGHFGFPKTQLGYHLSSKLRTDIGFVYHQATVKLADNSPIEAGGFFQSKNWRASWQAHYLLNKQVELRFGIAASVSNKLILYSRDYHQQDHFYGNQGLGWHLGVSYRL